MQKVWVLLTLTHFPALGSQLFPLPPEGPYLSEYFLSQIFPTRCSLLLSDGLPSSSTPFHPFSLSDLRGLATAVNSTTLHYFADDSKLYLTQSLSLCISFADTMLTTWEIEKLPLLLQPISGGLSQTMSVLHEPRIAPEPPPRSPHGNCPDICSKLGQLGSQPGNVID